MKLKTKLSKLRHDGHITDAEYSIIINALNRKPKERVIAEIKVDEDTLRKLVKDKVEELTTKFATQPPKTKPCEDCISRQAAIDEIEYELEMINSALDSIALDFNARERLRQRKGEVREILNSIQQLPSVTLLQKTGHWITWKEAGNEIPSETRFECSVCHDATQTLCNGLDLLSSYCPNCGARMEG